MHDPPHRVAQASGDGWNVVDDDDLTHYINDVIELDGRATGIMHFIVHRKL